MSTADRQVIEMANRPRERLDRMEKMAKIASYRRAIRRQEQEEERHRRAVIAYRLQWVAAVAGLSAAAVGMMILAVVL